MMTKHFGLANYPKGFRGCVVSPLKICMQFESPTIKLRTLGHHDVRKAEVNVAGTEWEVTAVGCMMPVLEEAQHQLIEAYSIYAMAHAEKYRETYGKEFKDFLDEIRNKLNGVIEEL